MRRASMRTAGRLVCAVAVAAAVVGCGRQESRSGGVVPGQPASTRTELLEAGAAALQSRAPIGAINAYLDGFHFRSGDMQDQVEAHHYCAIVNEDVIQCVLYDGNTADAKLTGIEYIVSEALYTGFAPEEKRLWHSHVHEVKSGQLIAPGVPEPAERALMRKLVKTYGKTWHAQWSAPDGRNGALPLGSPQLMMGFTADGQLDPKRLAERDARLGIRSEERREARASIPAAPVNADADAWQKGEALQLAAPAPVAPTRAAQR